MRLPVFLLMSIWMSAASSMEMDHHLYMVDFHQLEWQSGGDATLEMESWYGDEISKWTVDVELEKASEDLHSELTVGYKHAMSAFFDGGLVLRRDNGDHQRTWAGFRISGTAPYFVHTNIDVLSHRGDLLLDMKLEHEFLLTTHWSLKTKAEYEALLSGGGSKEAEVGIRFVYETPSRWGFYVGYEWQASFDEDETDQVLVSGFSYWF